MENKRKIGGEISEFESSINSFQKVKEFIKTKNLTIFLFYLHQIIKELFPNS